MTPEEEFKCFIELTMQNSVYILSEIRSRIFKYRAEGCPEEQLDDELKRHNAIARRLTDLGVEAETYDTTNELMKAYSVAAGVDIEAEGGLEGIGRTCKNCRSWGGMSGCKNPKSPMFRKAMIGSMSCEAWASKFEAKP